MTRAKRISQPNALHLSIGFILTMWLIRVIRNTYYFDDALNRAGSVQQLSLKATVYGAVTVLTVTLLLRLSGESHKDIGFDTHHIPRQLGNGFLFGALIFVVDTLLIGTIVDTLLPDAPAQGIDMSILFDSIYFLPAWIFVAIFKGGFAEELWRIFTLTRFERCFGKSGLVFALTFGAVIFGVGHLYQGVGGMISTAIVGSLFGLVYLRRRRAFEAVFAHAAFDMIGITLGYIIY
jgi:membrane protease YdiL (CAAX protease family)